MVQAARRPRHSDRIGPRGRARLSLGTDSGSPGAANHQHESRKDDQKQHEENCRFAQPAIRTNEYQSEKTEAREFDPDGIERPT